MTIDVRQAVPDAIDSRAVVAMVGMDTARMGEDAPTDCDFDGVERDILYEFDDFRKHAKIVFYLTSRETKRYVVRHGALDTSDRYIHREHFANNQNIQKSWRKKWF